MTKAEEQLPDSVRIQNADHFFASLPAVIKHGGIVRSILQRAISFNCRCSSSSNLRKVTYRPCVMNLAIMPGFGLCRANAAWPRGTRLHRHGISA